MSGKTLGPYHLLKPLGKGATSKVWLAEVATPVGGLPAGKQIAVKVIYPHLVKTKEFLERLRREVEMGKSVRHENVVRTYHMEVIPTDDGDVHTIGMEYVQGQTLRNLLDELGWCPERLTLHIGRELASALAAVHDADIIHRDVKPENVLITREEVVKLMDLGVARLKDEVLRLSQPGSFVGTPLYGSPEQIRGEEHLDGRLDLYALGVVLYELSTGDHPFGGRLDTAVVIKGHLHDKPRMPSERNPQISTFLEEMMLTLLEKKRKDRFASALDLHDVLNQGEDSTWWGHRSHLLRARTRRSLRRMRIPRETKVYGRDTQITGLENLFREVRKGEGRAVLIQGEAGIGKSRLVDEFAVLADQGGEEINFLYGSYPPGGAATASGAITSSFRDHLGTENLEPALAERLDVAPEVIPALAAWILGEPLPPGEFGLTKDTLEAMFVRLARSIADDRPTVLLIDDLHFAPPEGLSVFASLVHALAEDPILIVGTFRPGLPAKWVSTLESLTHVSHIRLERLGARDLQLLLKDALHSDPLADDIGGAIAVKSDGNPFFVFEILKSLKERDVITRNVSGTWVRTGDIRRIEIPDSVKDLVKARISDLDEDDRDLLDVASCCGFEFDPVLVGEVLGRGRIPTLKKLTLLSRRHRLVHAVGREFVFDHHQVRDALYGSLSELLREEYHGAIAEELLRREGVRSPEELPTATLISVLDHLLRAGRGDDARPYLTPALASLEAANNFIGLDAMAERALALEEMLKGRERMDVLLLLAKGRQILGRMVEARSAYEEADTYVEALDDPRLTVRSLLRKAAMKGSEGNFTESRELSRQALRIARKHGDREGETSSWRATGVQLKNLGFLRIAEAHLRHALSVAEEIGLDSEVANCRAMLARLFDQQGRFDEARVHHEEAIRAFRRVGNRLHAAICVGNYGAALYAQRRYDEARARHEEHRELCRSIGYRRGEVIAESNLGSLNRARGDHLGAKESFERNQGLFRDLGDVHGVAQSKAQLAETHMFFGEFEQSIALWNEARETFGELSDRFWEALCLLNLGRIAGELGEDEEAELRFSESIERLRQVASRPSIVDGLITRARFLLDRDRFDEAAEILHEALEIAEEMDLPARLAHVRALLSLVPGEDATLAEETYLRGRELMEIWERMEAAFCLFRATKKKEWLDDAGEQLDRILAPLPPADRSRMLRRIELNSRIDEARHMTG